MGDNLLKQEDSAGKLDIGWWKDNEVEACVSQIMVKTFYDVLDKVCMEPCDGNFTTAIAKGKAGERSKVKPASIPGCWVSSKSPSVAA